MGGQLSRETKEARALASLREIFGDSIVPEEMPAESQSDLMREAQAVLWYFETSGRAFKEKPCKGCDRIFAYSWNSQSIGYCSILCAKKALQNIGLDWDPSKSPAERWGKTMPAVVPPDALELLKSGTKESLSSS